jgi:hypothetical protein
MDRQIDVKTGNQQYRFIEEVQQADFSFRTSRGFLILFLWADSLAPLTLTYKHVHGRIRPYRRPYITFIFLQIFLARNVSRKG